MGLVIPRLSPFIYRDLAVDKPGIIFLVMQFSLPLGALISGYFSDKTLLVRLPQVLQIIFAASACLLLTTGLPESVTLYALLWALFGFAMGGAIPLINVSYLQSGHDPDRFGRVRLFGTLGFLIPNLLLIPFEDISRFTLIRSAGIFFLLSIPVLFLLPAARPVHSHLESISLKKVGRLLFSPPFFLFILGMFLFFFQFSPAEYIVSNYLEKIEFYGTDPVSVAWFLGPAVEIVFFFFSPALLRKTGPLFLIGVGFAAGIIRYGGTILMGESPEAVIWQFWHGIHFGAAYLGGLIFLERKAHPQRLATAQALMMVIGRAGGSGAAGFILGNIAADDDYAAVFLISMLVALIGAAMFYFYYRRYRTLEKFVSSE